MFSRIKGAIDRTIAEEQARQKSFEQAGTTSGSGTAQHRQSSSVSRSNSANAASAAGKKPTARQKKATQDASKDADSSASNPDPSVFEAAFVIDDDEPSRSTTPLPASDEKRSVNGDAKGDTPEGDVKGEGKKNATAAGSGSNSNGPDPTDKADKNGNVTDGDRTAPPTRPTAVTELPPDVRAKLRKLEKLESTYPGQPGPFPSLSGYHSVSVVCMCI